MKHLDMDDLTGYTAGAPSAVAAEIDGEIAANAQCGECGRVGLTYRLFARGSSYRAFLVCPHCRTVEEF